jgi:hypothetical protein
MNNEIKLGYIHVPHYTPYISSSKTNTSNTTIQTKEFTEEEIYIAGTFTIICCVILIVLIIYMIKEFIKYSK